MAEEIEKLKKLVRDDVIDDEEHIDDRLKPLLLPRVKQTSSKIKKNEKGKKHSLW